MSEAVSPNVLDVAIIAMAGRFPGADTLDAFWQNLRSGVESITFFAAEALTQAGVAPVLQQHPHYVPAGGVLSDIQQFDAFFFGYSPGEAASMDPQHRLFLECAWEALERAGYDPGRYPGLIGVYAGTGMNTYLYHNLHSHAHYAEPGRDYHTMIASDKDFLATKAAYKLNLKGPAVTIQTACSTSLVAIHMACQSLRSGECDIALAGGVSLRVPHTTGYLYQEGMILSPDGHCRAFDAAAQGTVIGSGVGIVVLKMLEDALADRDAIYAVIKGSAINNDGAQKAGYTAPSLDAQAAVILEAHGVANVPPDSITYVEAHGTGTSIGDPIEMAALAKAFRAGTKREQFCAVGSVKTNIGHLDAAAGVAGLIKTALALQHKQIPPSLHFEKPNPQIDLDNSPFYVNTTLSDWQTDGAPRRAGVSSFGIGGTNAHLILEEAPSAFPSSATRPWQILPLSAKTESALDTASANLVNHLSQSPHQNLADVAYTLQTGRRLFPQRQVLICQNHENALAMLRSRETGRLLRNIQETVSRPVAFMFTGQGTQYVNMAAELYRAERAFRQTVDQCCAQLRPHLGFDLRYILYPTNASEQEAATQRLNQTAITQPALFVVEYALAQLWLSWGIQPQAMIGHSIGEYVAACIAGVFSLEDALAVVAERGRLMQQLPAGGMLAVSLTETEVQAYLTDTISLAAVNSSKSCVVSGPLAAINALYQLLTQEGIRCQPLHTSHAFHSRMMEPILEPFAGIVRQYALHTPKIPYISNVTGHWSSIEEITNPDYWVQHLRQPVRFEQGLRTLMSNPELALLEVGPGRTLSTLARQHAQASPNRIILTSIPHAQDRQSDVAFLLTTLGKLWLAGVPIDWSGFYAGEQRQRVSLPTYPFERQRYWIDRETPHSTTPELATDTRKPDMADWFYAPSWSRSPLLPHPGAQSTHQSPWLLLIDNAGLGSALAQRLIQAGENVVTVEAAAEFAVIGEHNYQLNPAQPQDYETLLTALDTAGLHPRQIVHFWNVLPAEPTMTPAFPQAADLPFNSLLFLAQAIGKRLSAVPLSLTVISNEMQEVTGTEQLSPVRALCLGPVRIIPLEHPHITCRSVDVQFFPGQGADRHLLDFLWLELTTKSNDQVVAYRGLHRWVETFSPISLPAETESAIQFRSGGVYLITGGLGGIGFTLAKEIASVAPVTLILIGRTILPPIEGRATWLNEHGEADPVSQKIRRLQLLESLGARVVVISADVANPEQMRQVTAQVMAAHGQINGIIHAAGLPGGGMIQRKTMADVTRVMAPKVQGTLILHAICREIPLDFFVLCSSLNAVVPRLGQVDYTAANAFLDAFASYARSVGQRTISINWETWQEIGMAAAAAGQAPTMTPLSHPLLEENLGNRLTFQTYVTHFRVSKQWVLHEHAVVGKATLPGTTYLEMARAAVACHYDRDQMLEMQDVHFLTPLIFAGNEERAVYTILQKQADGFVFTVASHLKDDNQRWQEHARGRIVPLAVAPDQRHMLASLESQCDQAEIIDPFQKRNVGSFSLRQQPFSYDLSEPENSLRIPATIIVENGDTAQERFMVFGPRWHSLKWVKLGNGAGLALLELPPEFTADIPVYGLHPAMLDLATSFLRLFKAEGSYLPLSYGALKIITSLPARFYSYARYREAPDNGPTLSFDVTLLDETGSLLAEIEAFTVIRVQDVNRLATAAQNFQQASDIFPKGYEQPAGAARTNLAQDLAAGLLPAEGAAVFRRVIGSGLSRLIVSTRDLPSRIARAQRETVDVIAGSSQLSPTLRSKHARPVLLTAYAAPRNEMERKLAEIWQNVLGIDQVGVHDDFFELGGDSLLTAQVHRQFRDTFPQEITIANLLQHPTIADLSAFLASHDATTVPSFEKVQDRAEKQKEALKRRQQNIRKRPF